MEGGLVSKFVGTSERTPYKHWLLNNLLGQVVGVLSHGRAVPPLPLHIVDLCAGNGQKSPSGTSSPQIIAYHAAHPMLDGKVTVDFVEMQGTSYELLVESLSDVTGVAYNAMHMDAKEYSISDSAARGTCFVHCDPNHVNDMPLAKSLLDQFGSYTTYLVTLGCNVSGLKRLPFEQRAKWYGYVDSVIDAMSPWHDAILVSLNNDSSQWAYLCTLPEKWSKQRQQSAISSGNKLWKHGVTAISYRREPVEFSSELDRLFKTREECK